MITVSKISKVYGTQTALNNISFSAKKGEIIALLGPNGAGKSTLMKLLTGYIKPTEGVITVGDFDMATQSKNAQKLIGYLPEQNPLYTEMFVKEYLSFHADVANLPKETIDGVIEKVGLTAEAHKKIHQLSKGYQQRVGLAAAIIHNPEILILDEPTTGLDPNQLQHIRQLIKELGKEKTIIFSTHIMQEVEAICDRVLLLNKGNLLIDKPITEMPKNKKLEVLFNELTSS